MKFHIFSKILKCFFIIKILNGFWYNLKIFKNSICLSYEISYFFENFEMLFYNKNFKWVLV